MWPREKTKASPKAEAGTTRKREGKISEIRATITLRWRWTPGLTSTCRLNQFRSYFRLHMGLFIFGALNRHVLIPATPFHGR